MNLRSVQEKGSIEFRHHYGTHNLEHLLPWIKFILFLFKISKTADYTSTLLLFQERDYMTMVFEGLNILSPASSIDLKRCEQLANRSITSLLVYLKRQRDIKTEFSQHWPKTSKKKEII